VFRYNACWLPLLAKHSESQIFEGPLVVPLDCEWVWHCHRLNPVGFRPGYIYYSWLLTMLFNWVEVLVIKFGSNLLHRWDTNLTVRSFMDEYLTTLVLSLLLKEFVAGKLKKSGINCIPMNPTLLIWLIFSQGISLKGFLGLKSTPSMIWFQLLKGRVHSFTR